MVLQPVPTQPPARPPPPPPPPTRGRPPPVVATTPRLPPEQSLRPGIVVDPVGYQPRPVSPVAPGAPGEVFDLTVTAFQGYGSGGGGSRPRPILAVTKDGIITKAQPGDEFVSIDGKRTYFDIGPTVGPGQPSHPAIPPPQNAFNTNQDPRPLNGKQTLQHPVHK